jgi:hypothetical protein
MTRSCSTCASVAQGALARHAVMWARGITARPRCARSRGCPSARRPCPAEDRCLRAAACGADAAPQASLRAAQSCLAHRRDRASSPCAARPTVRRRGPVAVFDAGSLVAYRIRHRRQTRTFVFRTLTVDDRMAATVPGVQPRVQLLLDVRSAGRSRLVRGLFAYLVRNGRDPASLPDALYVRAGARLGGRLPAHKILVSLLATIERATGSELPGAARPGRSHRAFA